MHARSLPPFHPSRPHLSLPVRADPVGLDGPTRAEARGDEWRRTSQGFYLPAEAPASVEQRIASTQVLLPAGAAVTGWAALRWLGADWFDGRSPDNARQLPVVIASCATDVRAQHGVAICAERLDPREIVEVDGLRVTIPARSVTFEMRYAADVREATVALDMAAYADVVTVAEASRYALEHPGWTGIGQARTAVALADENSWSPWETRMRLVWVLDAGLPPPWCNAPVFDRWGQLLGTPDMIHRQDGLAGEFDGTLHLSGQQRSVDVRREALFRQHGLEYVTGLAADVARRTELADRLRQAHDRAVRLRHPVPAWTLRPPSWWHPSETVLERRALTGRAKAAVDARRRRTA